MKKIIYFTLLLVGMTVYSQKQLKLPPCATDEIMNSLIKENPKLKERFELINQEIFLKTTNTTQRTAQEIITIPVVVYIVHGGETNPENISDTQVLSQITALNTYFSPYNIKFCLATKVNGDPLPVKNTTTDTQTTMGIIHVNNYQVTNHHINLNETINLVNTAHNSINKDKYLRIWVVKSIDDSSGTLGYATFPYSSSIIDGIVMQYNVFGDLSNCPSCNLIPIYNQGKILAHEVGHYFGLYHTFHEGCAGMDSSTCNTNGDKVCDTPPVSQPNYNCALGTNSCNETPTDLPDNIHNFMDYGPNSCLYEFTNGQKERMFNNINLLRSDLFSNDNLIYTGVCGYEELISAKFEIDFHGPCTNSNVTFTCIEQEDTNYLWDFGDGNTSTDINPIHSYITSTNSPYTVTLTVTKDDKIATSTQLIHVTSCNTTPNSNSYWYLTQSYGLDFSSGIPVFDNTFPINHPAYYCSTQQSDQSGNLLFYNNDDNIWDYNHNQISTEPLGDDNTISSSIRTLIIQKPGDNTKNYIFSLGQNGFRYHVVNVNGSNVTLGAIKQPINFPSNNGYETATDGALIGNIGLSAIQNCNGYWILALLKKASGHYITVYSLTNAPTNDLSFVSEYEIPFSSNTTFYMEIAPNGNKILIYNNNSTFSFNRNYLFDFDKISGQISANPVEVLVDKLNNDPFGITGASFSPNSQLLYLINNRANSILQYNINTGKINDTKIEIGYKNSFAIYKNMQIGPDNKIYIANDEALQPQKIIHTIHQPNNLATPTNPNACYYSSNGPIPSNIIDNGLMYLPQIIDAKYETAYDSNNKISVYVSGTTCNTYKFFPNVCGSSFNWEFLNSTTGIIVSTSTVNNPVYTFSITGNYLISLKDSANQLIASTSLIIEGITQPVILGSSTTCISGGFGATNNSVVLPQGSTALWTITGGSGSISGANNLSDVNVNWTSLPGILTLTFSNENNCSTTVQKTITSSCITYGANNTVYTSNIQTDGKVIFGGDFTAYSGTSINRVARLKSDMTLDPAFIVGSGANGTVKSTAIQTDGKIIIGGTFTNFNGISKIGLARLNPNGSNDAGFNANLGSSGYTNALALQSDGKIIVGGKFTTINGTPKINIARLNTNGTVDTGFNSGFTSPDFEVNCIEIQSNGKIIIGGSFTGYNGNSNVMKIARLNSDGSLDNSFALPNLFLTGGANPNPIVYALKIQPDGKILVGGTFTTYTSKKSILRLNTDGTSDSTFLPDDTFSSSYGTGVRSIDLQNGKIIIGGGFHSIGGSTITYSYRRIARLLSNGSLDLSFTPGVGFGPESETAASRLHTIKVQSDNKIITGGSFTSFNNITVNNITRVDYVNSGTTNRPANENKKTEMTLFPNDFTSNKLIYYPNPVKNTLNLSYAQNISNVAVFNLLGQKVIENTINANAAQVDMSALSSGTYVVKVTSDNQTKTIKVIKE